MDTSPARIRAPSFNAKAFTCPHCGVFAQQKWELADGEDPFSTAKKSAMVGGTLRPKACVHVTTCTLCHKVSIWVSMELVYPDTGVVPPPNEDMFEEIKKDYREAAGIVTKSPRGAAALLRLCLQKLCVQLGCPGKNLDDDIGALVKRGLAPRIRKAMDALRLFGNAAVHPGEIDIQDDLDTATRLFAVLNEIAESLITSPKRVDALLDRVPEGKLEAIARRDKDKPK
jgi:hypothetical protein